MKKIGPNTTKVVVMSVGLKHLTYSDDAHRKVKRRNRDLCVELAHAQLLIDVSGLPNPHYVEELRPLTGRDEPVRTFLMLQPETVQLLANTREKLDVLLNGYQCRGNSHGTVLVVFRCTGGKHRSQFFAEAAKLMIEEIVEGWVEAVKVEVRHIRDERGEE